MHQILITIQECLESIITQVRSTVTHDNPLKNPPQTWNVSVLNRVDLIEEAHAIIDLIEAQGGDDIGEHETRLSGYKDKLNQLNNDIVSQLMRIRS